MQKIATLIVLNLALLAPASALAQDAPKPETPKPAEAKPAEEKPAEAKPAEEKPAAKPEAPKPAEEKPAAKPAEKKPAAPKPVEEKPAAPKQPEAKPATPKPAEPAKAPEAKPAEPKPAAKPAAKPATGAAKGLKDGIYAVIETNYGTMVGELYYKRVPYTVGNFVLLAEGKVEWPNPSNGNKIEKNKPFYDGLTFHRIIPKFMIQGGCPLGNGQGGPGYSFFEEFHPDLKHSGRGIFSMAKTRAPNTTGSQFFITLEATTWLDNKHSVFGKLVKGEDVLAKIGGVKRGQADKPVDPVIMKSVRIVRVGDAANAWVPSAAVKKTVPAPTKEADPAKAPAADAKVNNKIAALNYILIRYKGKPLASPVLERTKAEAMELGKKIVALLRQKDTKFSDIAEKYGDLNGGRRLLRTRWDVAKAPEGMKEVNKLQPGQISDPVDGPEGIYIYQLTAELEGKVNVVPEAKGEVDPAKVWNPKGEAAKEQFLLHFTVVMHKGLRGVPPTMLTDKKQALENAKRIVAHARIKGNDFVDVCEKYGDEFQPGQKVSGLPWRQQPNMPASLAGVSTLKPGQVSDPIDTPRGILIFSRPTELVEAKHILISYKGAQVPGQSRSKEDAKKLAEGLLAQLKSGEIKWNDACKNTDDKASGAEGNLGKFARKMMVPAFDKAVFQAKPGELFPALVETPFGYHIIFRIS